MAKKVVATLKKDKSVSMVKVIKSVKNKETGAYSFPSEIILTENLQEYLKDTK